MPEFRPELLAEYSREACSVVGCTKTSVLFLEVMVAEETIARPAQGPKIRTGMTKNPGLPDRIEAFDSGVAAGFLRRNEAKMDTQQEVKTDKLGETVAIPSSSCCGHLVVHLRDPGKPHNSPEINQMTTKRDRSLVTELSGRCGLAGDIKGVDGVEAGDPFGASEMPGPDHVGLLKVSHRSSSNVGIGRAAWSTLNFDLLCLAGPGQDLFDGRDGREPTYSLPLNLEMDRFGADAGEGGAVGFVGGQFIAQGQDLLDQRLRRLMRDIFRHPTSVTKSIETELAIATEPFGEPTTASMDTFHSVAEPAGFFIDSNGFEPDFIFISLFHDRLLLPIDFGRSVGDSTNCSRCPYGFTVHDVYTETHYFLFPGFRKDARALIAISNLLVLCSLEYESFGLVLVEAMVQGLPVIETRIGGVSEVVLDGINGLLVPPGDSLALAAAIQSLLSDRRLSAKMGRKGRELFEKRFSVTRMVDEVKKVYFAF